MAEGEFNMFLCFLSVSGLESPVFPERLREVRLAYRDAFLEHPMSWPQLDEYHVTLAYCHIPCAGAHPDIEERLHALVASQKGVSYLFEAPTLVGFVDMSDFFQVGVMAPDCIAFSLYTPGVVVALRLDVDDRLTDLRVSHRDVPAVKEPSGATPKVMSPALCGCFPGIVEVDPKTLDLSVVQCPSFGRVFETDSVSLRGRIASISEAFAVCFEDQSCGICILDDEGTCATMQVLNWKAAGRDLELGPCCTFRLRARAEAGVQVARSDFSCASPHLVFYSAKTGSVEVWHVGASARDPCFVCSFDWLPGLGSLCVACRNPQYFLCGVCEGSLILQALTQDFRPGGCDMASGVCGVRDVCSCVVRGRGVLCVRTLDGTVQLYTMENDELGGRLRLCGTTASSVWQEGGRLLPVARHMYC